MRIFIILILILIAVLIVEIIREQCYFKTTEYVIDTHNIDQGSKFTANIVFISDLHSKSYGKNNNKLLDAIHDVSPDLILIGGDMITSSEPDKVNISLGFLRELSKQAPCYYGLGNHEGRMIANPSKYKYDIFNYLDEVSNFGIHILDNESVRIKINDSDIQLTGLTLPADHYKRTSRDILTVTDITEPVGVNNLLSDQNIYNIVMAHDPSAYRAYNELNADLILSGHYHGGVIRFGQYGLITPQLRLFSPRSYGMSKSGQGYMIVTSGIGTHTLPMRLFNPAEIVVIKIKCNN